jgi:hypothetical protein
MKPLFRVILSWLAFSFTIALNALANILPINGFNTGEVSAFYPNAFVPDGFTFSIWSVIYLLLLVFVIYSTVLAVKPDAPAANKQLANAISPLFWFTCLLNGSWILAWHYLQLTLSLGIMLLFLVTLIAIFSKISDARLQITNMGKWLLSLPFVVYLAWICVATIANTAALLVHIEWGAFGISAANWASIMLGVAVLLAMWMVFRFHQPAFALVVAWAAFGIYRGQQLSYPQVASVASTVAIMCVIATVFSVFMQRKRLPQA